MKILIVGAGQVGLHLGKILIAESHDLTIVDIDPDACKKANDLLDALVIEGSGSSQQILQKAGIETSDMVIAVSAVDEVNVMVCLVASKVGVGTKIARLRNTEYSHAGALLEKEDLGIDFIIHPEEETARELVWLIKRSAATDVVEFAGGKIQLVGVRIDRNSPIVNQTLQQITEAHPDILFRVVAIFRNNQKTIIPTGRDVVNIGDQLFFITQTERVQQVLDLAGKSDEKLDSLMILGGGKVGRLVAAEMERDKHIDIKLIESSRDKSEKIAQAVRRTLIIMGDGTDIDLLATEGIMDMDGYVAVTDDEETNIISCLLAKHLGVKRTLALVNRSDYMPVMSSIGLDAAVDKQMITANAILRFIRRGNIVSFAALRGIDAEVFEIDVNKGTKIAGKTLKQLKLPRDMIIGLVIRNGQVFVPIGESSIQPGDKLIIFTLPTMVKTVEKLFN